MALLAALAAAALLAQHVAGAACVALLLFAVCLRAPAERRRLYLVGTLLSAGGVFVLTPFIETIGSHPIWAGPIVPVLGQLDITNEELASAGLNALRLAAVGLAFSAYALLLDHDGLLQAVRFARPAALATRLMPTLERDAVGFLEALRGRGVEVNGMRGRAILLSPLLASALERGLNLAEAMEARGYGRAGRTSLPQPRWRAHDWAFVALAAAIVTAGVLWL
ncbi:MAG: energy-coupling factor transport system permease protein [Gaiellaceae bacterium]|jgi:energy-coupling factor transport system permease protein|nr:energy-coupling factor transport system permease protein [Gaiellaceae bacterium]